jgi:hypothetical protein
MNPKIFFLFKIIALRRAGPLNADQETLRNHCVDEHAKRSRMYRAGIARGQVPIRHLPLAPRCANVTCGAVQAEWGFEWLPRRPPPLLRALVPGCDR